VVVLVSMTELEMLHPLSSTVMQENTAQKYHQPCT
jgi:hypothetical protein